MEREAKKTPAPEGENWLEQYTCLVLTGKITACRKVRTLCAVLLDKLRHPEKYRPWVFDEALANHHIEFVERFCKQPQGKLGAPLRLELFQKARWQAIFGFVDAHTGLRQYQECMIVEGRKNGKTTECAGIEIDLLVNDGEGAPEIYSIATKREQAAKSFNACVNMRKQSPELAAAIRKRQSDLYYPYNLGFITALASATNTLDGLNAHGVLVDELAAIKNRAIYDDMKQSMSAREQPLLFSISTNGFVRESIFDAQYEYAAGVIDGSIDDDTFLAWIYELDERDEYRSEKMWIKANPGLGTIKKVDYLRRMVKKADTRSVLPADRAGQGLQPQGKRCDKLADLGGVLQSRKRTISRSTTPSAAWTRQTASTLRRQRPSVSGRATRRSTAGACTGCRRACSMPMRLPATAASATACRIACGSSAA